MQHRSIVSACRSVEVRFFGCNLTLACAGVLPLLTMPSVPTHTPIHWRFSMPPNPMTPTDERMVPEVPAVPYYRSVPVRGTESNITVQYRSRFIRFVLLLCLVDLSFRVNTVRVCRRTWVDRLAAAAHGSRLEPIRSCDCAGLASEESAEKQLADFDVKSAPAHVKAEAVPPHKIQLASDRQ